jgi:hypothetical protein
MVIADGDIRGGKYPRNTCTVLVRKPKGKRSPERPKHIQKYYRSNKNPSLDLQRNLRLFNSWHLRLLKLIRKNSVLWDAILCSLVISRHFEEIFHLRVQFDYLLPARLSETPLNLHHISQNYYRYGNIFQFNPVRIPSDYFCRTVAYPEILFGGWGWGVQNIRLRTEGRENGDLRAVAP